MDAQQCRVAFIWVIAYGLEYPADVYKRQVLENAPMFAREAADKLAEATGSDVVQVIGMRFVLFRRNLKNPKISLKKEDIQ